MTILGTILDWIAVAAFGVLLLLVAWLPLRLAPIFERALSAVWDWLWKKGDHGTR